MKLLVFLSLAFHFSGINFLAAEASAESTQFVGSARCADCHQQVYERWRLSDHHRAMQAANIDSVLGKFDGATVSFHDIDTRLFHDDSGFKVETVGGDGEQEVFKVAYTFGHYPLQQYLVDIGNGQLQALNVAWDSRPADQGGQRWFHLQADEDIDPEHPFFWTRHFQNANSRCIECHSTAYRKQYDNDSKSYASSWSEPGVGCESCHGPAATHLALAQAGELDPENPGFERRPSPGTDWSFRGDDPIASPAGNGDQDFIDTCGGCHSRRASIGEVEAQANYHDQYRLALLDQGLYFDDGQIDDEVFVLGSFLQSEMHLRGVSCQNCHEPHSGKLIASGNALCAQCHRPDVFDSSRHHRHQNNSAGALCVNCHMPERLYMSVDPRRDHGFLIPDPELSQRSGAPNACNQCHQDRDSEWAADKISTWGGGKRPNAWALVNQGLAQQNSLVFRDYARNASTLKLPPIRQATLTEKLGAFASRLAVDTVSGQLSSADPLIRRAAVSALRGVPPQLRWQLLNALIADPVKTIRFEVAGALADAMPLLEGEDAERLGALIDEFRRSLTQQADTPGGQLAIGNLEQQLGFSILAERAYLRALEIEPHFVPALINLADLYRSIGSDGEARELLLEALEVAPDSANTHHAWGLFLVRSNKADQAMPYLRRASELDDSTPRHVYVYAVALDSAGQTRQAIDVIAAASERWPNHIDLYFLQVSYMDKTGVTDGIHNYLSTLDSIAAGNPQVRRWMQKYGGR